MRRVTKGSVWRYKGPGDGQGFKHRIIEVHKKEGIITWSSPSQKENEGGYSWLGDETEFRKQFE